MNLYLYSFYYLIYGFVVNFIFLHFYIKYQLKNKDGEDIKDFLTHHQGKQSTPNKGGIGFFITLLPILLYFKNFLLTFVVIISFILGILDDLYKKNGGVKSYVRLILWGLVALFVTIYNYHINDGFVIIPIINKYVNMKSAYVPVFAFFFLAALNSVAVSDGLDGMISFPLIMNFIFLSIVSIFLKNYEYLIICVVTIGFLLSFLFFNINKAKIFMSECGSILCGTLLLSLYFLLKVELFLWIFAALFAINIISTTLQVIAIRIYKKKIFKMAPLHHHFELSGFSETTIVFYVWLISLLLFIVGLYSYFSYIL